jgi:hypothetical protein
VNNVKPNDLTFIEYDYYRHNRLNEFKVLNLVSGETYYLHDSFLNLPSEVNYPLYSLDGQSLYFLNSSHETKHIVSLDLNNNQYRTIADQFTSVTHISLIDEDHLLITGQILTTRGIWLLNINDLSIKSILPSTGGQKIVQSYFKEEQLYYATYKAPVNLMIADIKNKKTQSLPQMNSDANELFGIYSKDNKTIYFVSSRTGYEELWSYNIDTKKNKQITQLQASSIQKPLLSHKEEYLAVVYKKEKLTFAVISLVTGEPISKAEIPSMKYPLAWSQNDEILYVSEHKGQVNIYQYDRHTLQPTLIQKNAGLFAQQSSDETNLMLIDYKSNGLIKKSLINNDHTLLNNAIANLSLLMPGELEIVGQSIMTVKKEGTKRQLQQYPIVAQKDNDESEWLMDLPDGANVNDYNIDGTKAIFTYGDKPQGDIMKVVFSQ